MTLLLVFLGFAPSALLASWLPPADKVVAFFLRQLDVAVTQERIGLTIKVVFIGTLTFLHLLEVVLVLRPLMRKYNMTSTFSRLAYVRLFTFLASCLCKCDGFVALRYTLS